MNEQFRREQAIQTLSAIVTAMEGEMPMGYHGFIKAYSIDGYDIMETGSRGIGALMFNSRKEANQFNMIFFSNILRVSFDIRYKI